MGGGLRMFMMGKDANSSKEEVKTPMSKEKEWQEYLIAAAEILAEDETERLKKAGDFLETEDKFAAFHESFFEKLAARVAKDVAKATDSSLGEHGVPEEVAMKVNEFQGAGFELTSRILPAKVMACPHAVSSELWREEGKRLIAAAVRKTAKEKKRSVPLLLKNGTSYVTIAYRCRGEPTLQAWLSQMEAAGVSKDSDEINDLLSVFEAAGYVKESRTHEGVHGWTLISLTW